MLLPAVRSLSRRKSAAVIDVVVVDVVELDDPAPLTIVGFIENDHDILHTDCVCLSVCLSVTLTTVTSPCLSVYSLRTLSVYLSAYVAARPLTRVLSLATQVLQLQLPVAAAAVLLLLLLLQTQVGAGTRSLLADSSESLASRGPTVLHATDTADTHHSY